MKQLKTIGLLAILMGLIFSCCLAACSGGDDDDESGDDDDEDDDVDDDDDDDESDSEPPTITNTTRLPDTIDISGPYEVTSDVADNVEVAEVRLHFRIDGGEFVDDPMSAAKGGATYGGQIPGQAAGSLVEYYISAEDASQNAAVDPAGAPTELYRFYVLDISDIAYDDGSMETNYGGKVNGTMLMVRFTPPSYPAYLLSMSYYGYVTGAPLVRAVAVYDEDGLPNPPDAAGAIELGDPFTPAHQAWSEIDLSDVEGLDEPLVSGDVYVGFKLVNVEHPDKNFYLGWDTDSTDVIDREWFYDFTNSEWKKMTDFEGVDPGAFMLRVTVAHP